jgi:hypothetical protein
MSELRYTLACDGSFDAVLLPVLDWLLFANGVTNAVQSEWADLGRLPRKPRTLAEKIYHAVNLYPCDLLFVHRDAENQGRQSRVAEITGAIQRVREEWPEIPLPLHVCVVPIRMTEAWLLFNEAAIRRAAGNANGHQPLALPSIDDIENLPDPKSLLYAVLRQASGLHGRRLRTFPHSQRAHRLSRLIPDFSDLRRLSAFKALETDVVRLINEAGWNA